jgi:bifunctional non-homologous end joining protein LigD
MARHHPLAGARERQAPASGSQRTPGAGDASPSARARSDARSSTFAQLPAGLRVTHAERLVDADSGITKGDVAAYYASVAALILPHLKGRPVALLRAPAGVPGEKFFQKHAEAAELPGVKQLDPALDPGHDPLLEIATREGLLSAAQMNVLELHTWNATARAIGKPDRMVFDLDPGEGVGWTRMQEAARLLQSLLDEVGLACLLKTSGGKGLHVIVPLTPRFEWQDVRAFSKAIVEHLASAMPERFAMKSGAQNRVRKIFVDYLRNGWGATTAAAWSPRARPGLGVSVPVSWDELDTLTAGDHWTLRNIADRFAQGNTPWAGAVAARRPLSQAMKALGFDPKENPS